MNQQKRNTKKILIVNYEFPPLGGGGGVATYDLALEWCKAGQVDVLTSNYKGLASFEKVDGINVHRVPVLFRKSRDAATFFSMLSYVFFGFFKGIALVRKHRYDVINTHFAVPSGPLGYVIGKIFKIPNVLSLHGGDIYDPSKKMSPHKSPVFKRVVKFILNRADRIVAQSSNTRNNTIQYYAPSQDIAIVPLAFHEPAIPAADRGDFALEETDFYLVTVGRLVKRKAIETMLEALSKVSDQKVKLIIVGDGPEREFLENLVTDLSLQERVRFAGYLEEAEKFSYIKNSDLFIMTSLHEGFGIVFMEAMYFGIPIVCTNHGGQVDFLKNEENAILIDVGDVDACRAGIERFVTDKKLYKKCSANNKKKVVDFYAENIAAQYLAIFDELIDKSRSH